MVVLPEFGTFNVATRLSLCKFIALGFMKSSEPLELEM
jgi:hypothetical protein